MVSILILAAGGEAAGQEVASLGVGGASPQIYWDYPQILVPNGVSFPQEGEGGGLLVTAWQHFSTAAAGAGQVSVSVATSRDGRNWKRHDDAVGPFPFSGTQVSIFALAVDSSGRIFLALNVSGTNVDVYSSSDEGGSFRKLASLSTGATTVAPRLFVRASGGLVLFVAQGGETVAGLNALSIRYSLSRSGSDWSVFHPLVTNPDLSLNFAPAFLEYHGREYVVFQVLRPGTPAVYQLYLKWSLDGGASWSPDKRLVVAQQGTGTTAANPLVYSDERPYLIGDGGKLSVVWERSYQTGTPQIYWAQYDLEGNLVSDVERVSSGFSTSHDPRIAIYGGQQYVFWFDNRAGSDHVIAATFNGVFWQDNDLSRMPGASIFARPIVVGNDIYVFWFNQIGDAGRLVELRQNRTAPEPKVFGVNFRLGARSNLDTYVFGWTQPDDPSGIAGFSYVVDRNADTVAPRSLNVLPNDRQARVTVTQDGEWYIHVATEDFAGNWSATTTTSFVRDTTPPGPVIFAQLELDKAGYLHSNTYTIDWTPPEDKDVAGYTYTFDYLSADASRLPGSAPAVKPPDRVLTTRPDFRFSNEDNGVWALSVAAIDSVGNVGPSRTILFRMDKYIPVTYVTDVQATRDVLGDTVLTIYGRGFAAGGDISEVILDRDGKPPYDYVFRGGTGEYKVETDRIISGLRLTNVDAGTYRVGLIHPTRGLYFTGPLLTLEPTGTVKFGNYAQRPSEIWQPLEQAPILLSVNSVIVLLVLAVLAVTLFVSIYRIGRVVEEGRALRLEVQALLTGARFASLEREVRLAQMKRLGMGLRVKFVLLITMLVIVVVLMVSIPLGYFMITTQERSLADGLEKKAEVLLDSLATGARTYLPDKNILELGALPELRVAMNEALYVTITGYGAADDKNYNYVWASDDPNILNKIGGGSLNPGFSRITDDITSKVPAIRQEIDTRATKEVSGLSQELQKLGAQAALLATKDDPQSAQELARYQQEITAINKQVNSRLFDIGNIFGSVPPYDVNRLSQTTDRYTFFKPIVYRSNQDSLYFRGMIRLGVSTSTIIQEIKASQRTLIVTAAIVALVAIGLGVGGALILASIIIIPIRRLVRGVEVIRDTEDKERLKSHVIDVKTRDELSVLAETVNEMTRGLVAAAVANKDLVLGKDTQKMFTPLEQDPATSRKLTTAHERSAHAEFFGYYEGAKGVSGDYFDYRKLDEKHYAVIECDVAGKGVPASLIMVEVATIFIDYFRNWKLKEHGIHLEQLVNRINDLLEERGFKGRFAALLVAIINVETGDCTFCNAGYKYVHLFDAAKGAMIEKTLPDAPAAGVFPSMLVDMKGGFRQIPHRLLPGDCLLLFTDGVEEAKRHFRNEEFRVITCEQPGLAAGELHDNHPVGSDNEEFGIPRIHAVIDAVFGRGRFTLDKHHNAVADEVFTFDYSSCAGTVEEAVLALVSAERLFRLYRDPQAGADDRVMVDRKIAEFLRAHFDQYPLYFGEPIPHPTLPEYVYFTNLREDEQYDDLTILGIRKL